MKRGHLHSGLPRDTQICEMIALWLVFSLALAGAASGKSKETKCRQQQKPVEASEPNQPLCEYQNILTDLKLKKRKGFSAARPVKDWKCPTVVYLELYLYAILEVVEKAQTFTPFFWTYMEWENELLSWDPDKFCGIKKVVIPREMLWRPDLMILECIQDQHKMFMMPYVQVYHDGRVSQGDTLKAKSTCKIDAYRFPFESQSCDLTFCSALYTDDEIRIQITSNSSWLTRGSREHQWSQGDWDFINFTVETGNITTGHQYWSTLTCTINFKRRPMAIVLHFMLPLLFFLILDLCTFFISDSGGENLGFKVTLLLAISVLLLILNEILPSSSGGSPLIAIYCVGTFTLLFVSLLEAILVKYLKEKDDTAVEDPAESETPVKEGLLEPSQDPDVGSGVECTDSQLLRRAAQVLHALRRSILAQTEAKPQEEKTPLYWTRVAKRLHKAFFILYFIAVLVMLVFLSVRWSGY